MGRMRVDELKRVFKNNSFTSKEFYNFYLEKEPGLKKATFRWRVHDLKNDGIIYSPKRGLYVISSKKDFKPIIDNKLYGIYKKLNNKFPYSNLCIWETNWLNNYMVHQVISNNIIIEIDKETAPSALAFLQESLSNIYLNPRNYEIENYIRSGQSSIIIKNLLVDSPIDDLKAIVIPKIEKIIVDLFAEDALFVTYQGEELKNIYKELFNQFTINQSTIKRYAARRNVADDLITFLREKSSINDDEIYI